LQLIKRSQGDSILAEQIGLRADIPRHLFQQLIAKASDEVRKQLERERPELVEEVRTSVGTVTAALHAKFGPASPNYHAAKRAVAASHTRGDLSEKSIFEYALSKKLEETTVGLSLLCSLPINVVERALIDSNKDTILIICKSIAFSWATTMSILFLGAPHHRIAEQTLDKLKDDYAGLTAETSQSVLAFYQARRKKADVDSEADRLPRLHAV
jgi:hypothetical protein